MTQKFTRRCIFFLALFSTKLPAQSTSDYAVQLTATTVVSPASITLHWINDPLATSYSVDRKTKTATSWEPALVTLPGTANQYSDNTVVADSAYEYRVQKVAASYTGRGYIYAGILAPPIHFRGKMLLMIDSLFNAALPTEIFQLMKDISADGWAVEKFVVGRNDAVTVVKGIIVNAYNADPIHVKAVLLVGHIPVPYSGNINPDGHPDHLGAWPADVYYGDINGIWTDNLVNNSSAARPENRNLPGDGKFDNSFVPTNVELQVSRIDFNNMPSFAQGEVALMSSYLNKNHAYKWKMIEPSHRSLVDDNFGAFGGEAFASSGWRNFSPLVGDTNIFNVDFISSLNTSDYQWAYGCGGGWFQGAGGIGTTANFSGNSVKGIFTMLFGSYFGDWDSQDNFLRAPLCADDPALTCAWAGRPHWFFHHMAMGENIGYSAKWTQNNSGTYVENFGLRYVHIALMGDLSLRQDAMLSPSTIEIKVSENNNGVTVSWVSSTDSPIGYYVYRSNTEFGKYNLISPLVTENSFLDTNETSGLWYYMVRAAKIQNSPSGTYINLSEGIVDSLQVDFTSGAHDFILTNQLSVFPNPASQSVFVSISNLETHAALHIYDMYGKLILKRTISSSLEEINVSEFPAGIYLLSINTIKGSVVKRFEVLK
ncbi:MAG: T9SS type A sorting domain-containing protein [Saprospiraceae bacterium]|nr:T9SS type A sorting domain-containing protein [Saprospiraceae bacterium]